MAKAKNLDDLRIYIERIHSPKPIGGEKKQNERKLIKILGQINNKEREPEKRFQRGGFTDESRGFRFH
ncbi:hypothetical protein K2173_021954 [Erythroxylum novogranatense]|uniref:Uncharacterized protein n=1 Tax=Erythroxylum novogranatense TaxID=1862640 RepID=A0AAV8T2D4_9ROSI|nr:hypothetical protein K2173_021954 [Erythroxylum novogranatense]